MTATRSPRTPGARQPARDAAYRRLALTIVGLDPNGHRQGITGPVAFLSVDDIRGRLEALVSAGAEVVQDVRDVGNGRLVASLKDADGNMLGLMQDTAS